jgi:hypothetical protein
MENEPGSLAGFVPGISFSVDSPRSPHHQVDEEHPIIGEIDAELFSMGLDILNAKIL